MKLEPKAQELYDNAYLSRNSDILHEAIRNARWAKWDPVPAVKWFRDAVRKIAMSVSSKTYSEAIIDHVANVIAAEHEDDIWSSDW